MTYALIGSIVAITAILSAIIGMIFFGERPKYAPSTQGNQSSKSSSKEGSGGQNTSLNLPSGVFKWGLLVVALATAVMLIAWWWDYDVWAYVRRMPLPNFDTSFWVIVFILAALAAWALPAWRWVIAVPAVALFVVLSVNSVSGSINWIGRSIERCANSECGPDTDHFPTYRAGYISLESEQGKTIILAGRVRTTNEICHKIDVSPEVRMSWSPDAATYYLEPLDGLSQQLTTVTMVKSYDTWRCRQYWAERGG